MTGPPRPGRIVCGVNGSSSSRGALAEAVRRAVASGARVTAVTAYDAVGYYWGALASLPGADLLPAPHEAGIRIAEEATLRRFVASVLSDPRLVPPGTRVAVDVLAAPGHPVDVLVRESVGAEALVIGHGEEHGPLTSVAVGCSRRVRCPVVVVPLGSFAEEPGPKARGPRADDPVS